jgi:hypothetical protein
MSDKVMAFTVSLSSLFVWLSHLISSQYFCIFSKMIYIKRCFDFGLNYRKLLKSQRQRIRPWPSRKKHNCLLLVMRLVTNSNAVGNPQNKQ